MYKRQAFSLLTSERSCLILPARRPAPSASSAAVSYTHLPGVKLGLANVVVMYALFFLGRGSAFTLVLLKSFFVLLTRGAVSYTHLDVYKRQGQGNPGVLREMLLSAIEKL